MKTASAVALTSLLAAAAAGAPNIVDRTFMADAAADGLAEVELGHLAAERAQKEEVKEFGRMMVSDHTNANAELKALAAQEGVELPAEMRPPHKALEARLRKLAGAEFDAAYLAAMVKEHEKAVRMFTRASTSGGDPDVKAWAGKALPGLRMHLDTVRDLAPVKAPAPGR